MLTAAAELNVASAATAATARTASTGGKNRLAAFAAREYLPRRLTRGKTPGRPRRVAPDVNRARRRSDLRGGAAQRRRGYFAQNRLINRADRRHSAAASFRARPRPQDVARDVPQRDDADRGPKHSVHEGVKIRLSSKKTWLEALSQSHQPI